MGYDNLVYGFEHFFTLVETTSVSVYGNVSQKNGKGHHRPTGPEIAGAAPNNSGIGGQITQFPMVSQGFPWFPMVFNGFLWFPMVSYGFLWFPMVSYGFLWFSMFSYGFLWFMVHRS